MGRAMYPIELPYKSLPGLSARLISDHYELYLRYIKRFGRVERDLREAVKDRAMPILIPLGQESAFLRNAIRLHELYFESMSPKPEMEPEEVLGRRADDLLEEMRVRAMGATGWAILAFDRARGGVFVNTVEDHADGVVIESCPLLVCDLWEHAWMPEYRLDKEGYLDAFFRNVCWKTVQGRLDEVLEGTGEGR